MGSNNIKGLTVEIGGNTSKLSAALASADGQIKASSNSLKEIDRLLKLDPKNVELLEQKQRALSTAIDGTKERLQKLRTAQEQAEPNLQFYDAWKEKIAPINLDIEKTNESIRALRKEQRALEDSNNRDSDSYKALAEKIAEAEKKLKSLKQSKKAVDEEFHNPLSPEQYEALRREVINTEHSLQGLERSLSETEQAAKDAGKSIEDSGEDAAEAAKDTEKLNDALDELTGKYDDAKEAAKDSAKEFAATAAAGAAAVGVALNAAMSQEDALASIQAQTGKSAEDMQKIASAMDSVYRAGYGEDLDDVASTIAMIFQLTGEGKPSALAALAKDAIALRDTFGYETQESMRTAKMLVDQFGVSYSDAFGLIAQGTREGLNRNGDLLDIINEYSVHYKALGYGPEELFGSLKNGADAGAFSVDKLGDAMKEFNIRTKDGSDSTKEAFARLHLDADVVSEKFAAGGDSAREASEIVLGALLRMRDQVAQNEVGVALFGTMWEDLGVDAVAAMTDVNSSISITKDTMEEIKEVKYDTVSAQWKKLGREAQTELIAPIGEDLLPLAQKFCSYLTKNLDDLLPTVKGIATTAASMFVGNKVGNMVKAVVKLVQTYKTLKTATTAANAAMSATPWGVVGAGIGLVVGGIVSLINAENEAAEAERERVRALKQAADEQTEAYREIAESARDSAEARREAARAVNEEFDRYGELWRELEKLVDAEGNVIAGNEDRVEQIRGELSDAMGEEILLVDGQIQKYGELRDTIADTLALKRVEALTQEYRGDYDAAKSGLSSLQEDYEQANAIRLEYPERLEQQAKAERDLEALPEPSSVSATDYSESYINDLKAERADLENQIADHKTWLTEHANAEEDARLAREAYDQAVATIAQYEALTAAMYSGDTQRMLAAAEALENGIVESAHGAAYSTLYTQASVLYQDWQTLAAASQNQGSTVTQAQLDDMAELVAQAVYEGYVAAKAEGASQEELDALRSMFSEVGYGQYMESIDGHLSEFDSFMQYVAPTLRGESAAFEKFSRYLDGSDGIVPTIARAGDALLIETGKMIDLLRDVAVSVGGLDFTVVLDGEVISQKLAPNINRALGSTLYFDTRGSLSAR